MNLGNLFLAAWAAALLVGMALAVGVALYLPRERES
ncbi:MAG: hypothetical protein QOE36_1261 [Gaiellaceae bacterium]|nr:hypothetical protein [Gaiellaceae bacterium]